MIWNAPIQGIKKINPAYIAGFYVSKASSYMPGKNIKKWAINDWKKG